MAEIITMPRLSDTMEEGRVAKWHKNVGDDINEGDILAEIETDKAIQEFESEFDGKLLYVGVAEGNATKVDEILAIIGSDGEDVSGLINGASSTNTAESSNQEVTESTVTTVPSVPAEIPDGVEVVTMPRLSDTMEEGTVAKWHKAVGDTVTEGDILAEIETDKAVQEFESEFDGTLLHIGAPEGEPAKVESILAVIGPAGADVSGVVASFGSAPKAAAESTTSVKAETNPAATSVTSEVQTSSNGRIFASPLAKKIASEKGLDLSQIKGSGENGRIVKTDVENFTPQAVSTTQTTTSAPVQTVSVVSTTLQTEEVPNSQMRKVIAKRLAESKFSAPHFYLNIEVDMDGAIAFRKQLNEAPDTKISFNDIVVKASAMALKSHPQVNSTYYDDKIVRHGNINIGVAVAIDEGLLVPVVKDADAKSFTMINAEVKDLAKRSRERTLKANEMEGSTFTVSNLGAFGIESFTSIINQPNSCILSVGAIVQKPVVKDGNIVVGNTMKLTLACDHRSVDGATGAYYLQTLRQYLENPVTMFL